ncbi:MAG: DUF2520 domain-containing protein [Myxococcota bacterium]
MDSDPNLAPALRVFLLGTGDAGCAMGRWLEGRGHRLIGAWNRSKQRAERATEWLGRTVQHGQWTGVPPCDLVLVAVSDHAIEDAGALLRTGPCPAQVIAHLSGARPAMALGDLPIPRASLHPLVAMREPAIARRALDQALFTLEGDEDALEFLEAHLSLRSQRIRADEKPRYHAAAVMASNLVVALVAEATEIAESIGLEGSEAALVELAAVALENVRARGAARGLTGPVKRGDSAVLGAHLRALPGPSRQIYRGLSLRALELAREAGLPPESANALKTLLVNDGAE